MIRYLNAFVKKEKKRDNKFLMLYKLFIFIALQIVGLFVVL